MVHLIKNEVGKVVGWELKPVTEEDQEIAGYIRDLQFFGLDDTAVEYTGLKLIDPQKGKQFGNIKSIGWIQKRYKNETI